MKPDWKDAPEWANYLAMDIDGEWHWYESEPEYLGSQWLVKIGQKEIAGSTPANKSLEKRPEIMPSWEDAPEWANYLAMDECGTWWWYEYEPIEFSNRWHQSKGRWTTALNPSWATFLIKRME